MTPFLITLAIIAGLMSLALFVMVLTAREGWEDEQGFHLGRDPEIDFTHGEAYTK